MFSIFKRKKANINSISIPDFGWRLMRDEKDVKQWINKEKTLIFSLHFFDLKPDIPTLENVDSLRTFYRNKLIESKGGLIEVERIHIRELPVIKSIFKIPQEPNGITYLASLTIPFKRCSFVVKIQAPELGTTGVRDTIIADKLLGEGKVEIANGSIKNWSLDPYDTSYVRGRLMNISERVFYDKDFPNHPLSMVRTLLKQIEKDIEFKKDVFKLKPFKG